jgi:hypothetical protein
MEEQQAVRHFIRGGGASRLTQGEPPEPSRAVFDLDEELARSTDEGTIAHAAIARLAALTRTPSLLEVQALVDEALAHFAPIEARAHRQNIRGVVHRYFTRCLPPARFAFGGAEYDLGIGRADLVWFDFDEVVLADEVKAGSPRSLRLSTTTRQVERYRIACLDVWGDRFAGLRLLCPTDPGASLFVDPTGLTTSLVASPYLNPRN